MAGLAGAGFEARVVVGRVRPRLERRLQRRGFETPLTHVLTSHRELARDSFDVVHAFDAPNAAVAAKWSRTHGRPSVFTFPCPPDREWLVARRLRLDCVLRAVHGGTALITDSPGAAESLRRSLGVEAHVIGPEDGLGRLVAAHADLYRDLVAGRAP
jgi:hypothetical protein